MLDFTLLDYSDITGPNKLEILPNRGYASPITDFSILLGLKISDENTLNTQYDDLIDLRGASWWTKSQFSQKNVYIVTEHSLSCSSPNNRFFGIRPAINADMILKYGINKKKNKNGILEIQFGNYPQTVVNKSLANKLEYEFYQNNLTLTGNYYTTDSPENNKLTPFKLCSHTEFEYNNKRYIRVMYTPYGENKILSNNEIVANNYPYWIKVEPITWIIDKNKNIALSKNILLSGIQFCNDEIYNGEFKETNLKWFFDNYFEKEILNGFELKENRNNIEIKPNYNNSYGLNMKEVNEEEIIMGAIESDIPVFLHGKSGVGKSARIKEIDKDCIVIYLRNATLESINGKSVYNSDTNSMIDIKPSWLKKLEILCEKEPNKNHIVFFDEITNSLPSIQGIAFNIVLDREVNGIWKLPENARIVAAGNEVSDSMSANLLAEPLFNRFAHVYIETNVDSWLKWAIEHQIHPAIYGFIALKQEEVLNSKFSGERPNADPRKWEMASKLLYKTGKPEMIRALVGEEITREFTYFCNQKIITLEDVLSDNYQEEDLTMNISSKYATIVGLTRASIDNYEKVKEFVNKLGNEFSSLFDSMWGNSEERLEIIAENRIKKSK